MEKHEISTNWLDAFVLLERFLDAIHDGSRQLVFLTNFHVRYSKIWFFNQLEDNVINMCEIKYYSGPLKVNKDYYFILLTRQSLLANNVSKNMDIHSKLITTFDLIKNEYSSAFLHIVTMNDLFRQLLFISLAIKKSKLVLIN